MPNFRDIIGGMKVNFTAFLRKSIPNGYQDPDMDANLNKLEGIPLEGWVKVISDDIKPERDHGYVRFYSFIKDPEKLKPQVRERITAYLNAFCDAYDDMIRAGQ